MTSRIPRAPRTQVMGILNVTPDSFSDGGDYFDTAAAIEHGQRLLDEGADMIDVGGESTRPGTERTSEAEEMRRVLPVVEALAERGACLSVDTMRASVAAAAAAGGAAIINDVSGGLADPEMVDAVAESGCAYIVMHWRGHSTVMGERTHYEDVITDVCRETGEQVERALAAGIAPDNIITDPGIGFATTAGQNWQLLRGIEAFRRLGYPVLIAVSRKRFLGTLLAREGWQTTPKQRDYATAAITAWMAERGLWAVRTHSVRAQREAIAVVEELRKET